jgi:hypothetical protein
MRMHVVPINEIKAIVETAGGTVVRADESDAAGEAHRSKLYFVRRDNGSGKRS